MSINNDPSAIERLSQALAEIGGVRLGYLFGSRAKGCARMDSDYDIAVLMDSDPADEQLFGTIARLAGRLGREVPSAKLDLVLLNRAPALLRHRILRDGTLLYQKSAQDRVRFATRTIQDYQDGDVRRREFTRRRIERLKAGPNRGGSGDLLEKARGVAQLLAQAQVVPRS